MGVREATLRVATAGSCTSVRTTRSRPTLVDDPGGDRLGPEDVDRVAALAQALERVVEREDLDPEAEPHLVRPAVDQRRKRGLLAERGRGVGVPADELLGAGAAGADGVSGVEASPDARQAAEVLRDGAHPAGRGTHVEDRIRGEVLGAAAHERKRWHGDQAVGPEDVLEGADDGRRPAVDVPEAAERRVDEDAVSRGEAGGLEPGCEL